MLLEVACSKYSRRHRGSCEGLSEKESRAFLFIFSEKDISRRVISMTEILAGGGFPRKSLQFVPAPLFYSIAPIMADSGGRNIHQKARVAAIATTSSTLSSKSHFFKFTARPEP